MDKSNSVFNKIAFSVVGAVFCYLFMAGSVQAAELVNLQPATDMNYNERIRVNSAISVAHSSYFYGGVHIGATDGTGGVTFINGSVVNASDGSVPVTFGDDVRVDGGLWRGPSAGPGDNLPINIRDDLRIDGGIWAGPSKGNTIDGQSIIAYDSIRPGEDNKNMLGSNGYRWASGNFAGTVNMGKLGGNSVITEENLSATNNPQAGYVLTYGSNGQFQWAQASTDSSGILSDDDWTGAGTGTMYANSASDNVGIGLTSGAAAKLHVYNADVSNDAGYFETVGTDTRAVRGVANNNSSYLNYGGWFSADGTTGRGVHATTSGDAGSGVYGEATSTFTSRNYGGNFNAAGVAGVGVQGVSSGTLLASGVLGEATDTSGVNYGGFFKSHSSLGTGVYSTSRIYGTNSYVNPLAGATVSAAVIGQNYDGTTPISSLGSLHYGGFFESTHNQGRAVYGLASDVDGVNYGGYFVSRSSVGVGVYGNSSGTDLSSYSGYFIGTNFGIELGSTANTSNFRIINLPDGSGQDVQIDGNRLVRVVSSRRYKDNIQNLVVDTASVLDLQPVSFTYKSTGQADIGLIAEDVNETIPELVNYDEEGKPGGVKYDRIPVYLIELAREQQTTIENQNTRIEQLENLVCKYLPQEETCQDN